MSKQLSEMTAEELDAEGDRLTRVEEATVLVLGLEAGHTLTAEDVELIQFLESYHDAEETTAISTFHRGYQAGVTRAAGVDTAKLIEERDSARAAETVARITGRAYQRREFIQGAQVCREMMARFVEQGGDTVTAASIRANWRPSWGDDPGAPSEIIYATAKPIEIRETETGKNP